ncbi:hypothetical protein ISP15_04010 [Dyella jejuensis]|uniref:Fur family transcriptional regulator n=1 Tax=Dyella jejuensis TaxID=1432009 RepID=A0ABW8JER8_9GAMM
MKAEAIEEVFGDWQQRCKAQGLTLTVSRRAMLRACVEAQAACDAVSLLVAAQRYHPGVSIGSVYRFLRELNRRGLLQAQAQPHARTLWQLRHPASTDAAQDAGDIRRLLLQVQDLLHALEHRGLHEQTDAGGALPAPDAGHGDAAYTLLQGIAAQFGYRLLAAPRTSVQSSFDKVRA